MEPDRELIASMMEITGTTEEETRILYHLKALNNLLQNFPATRTDEGEADTEIITINQSISNLESLIH